MKMNFIFGITFFVLVIMSSNVFAQTVTNDLYQYNYTTLSPAFVGADGEKMTFMGSLYLLKAGGYNGFGYIGYESPIKKINSGVGFSLNATRTGNVHMSNLGFAYNYQLALGNSGKLIFGAKVTGSQFAVDSNVIPDINDPLRFFNGHGANTLTTTAAVLYKQNKFYAGLSVDNLWHDTNKLYSLVVFTGFYETQYNIVVGQDFDFGERLSTMHSVYVSKTDELWRFDINNSLVFNHWLIAGLSLEVNNSDSDNQYLPKASLGFGVKNRARFIFSAYSEKYNTGGKKFSGQTMFLFNL